MSRCNLCACVTARVHRVKNCPAVCDNCRILEVTSASRSSRLVKMQSHHTELTGWPAGGLVGRLVGRMRHCSVSQRTVIRASATCVALLVLAQALLWRQAQRSYRLAAGRRALGGRSATAWSEVPTSRHALQSRRHALPRIPGWKGQQSQLSGVCLCAVSVARKVARSVCVYVLLSAGMPCVS